MFTTDRLINLRTLANSGKLAKRKVSFHDDSSGDDSTTAQDISAGSPVAIALLQAATGSPVTQASTYPGVTGTINPTTGLPYTTYPTTGGIYNPALLSSTSTSSSSTLLLIGAAVLIFVLMKRSSND